MTSLNRKTSTSGRFGGTLVAAAALLLPAALLTQADGAAAQVPEEPPEITIYHSLDPVGSDPRSETIPPGCSEGVAGGGAITVIGDVDSSFPQDPLLYQNQTFYSNLLGAGTNVLAGRGRGYSSTAAGAVADYYNTLPGVTATTTNTTITSAILADVDLLIFNQVDNWNVPLVYTAQELTDISAFLAGGGKLLLVAEAADAAAIADFNVFLTGIGSSVQFTGTRALIFGPHAVVTGAPFMDGVTSFYSDAYNTLSGGTPMVVITTDPPDPFAGEAIVATTGGDGEAGPNCVLGGSDYEELKLWIFGGSTASGEGERICSQDFDTGEGIIEGGKGDEICGAEMTFQISGPGRFRGAIEAPEPVDAGIDTMVLGTVCTPGEGAECWFPPNLKQLKLNFRSGGVDPSASARFLGSLIIDSTGLDPTTPTQISVEGNGAGSELQLRPFGDPPEIIAAFPVPEPGQFVQLLSGLFGLAGLHRLRRKH